MQFPIFDLSTFHASTGTNRRVLCDRLDCTVKETEFFLLKGHGVPDEIIAAQWKVIDAFFALPVDEKQVVALPVLAIPMVGRALSKKLSLLQVAKKLHRI